MCYVLWLIVEGGAVESQLQLRDQTIYHLKQELASLREEKDATIFTLQEKIKEQISENEELRSQVQIKQEDGTSVRVLRLFYSHDLC